MKTLTKISTATLMGLLTVVLSANAIAEPGKKGDRPKGPKLSLDVVTLCELNASNPQDPILEVTTTITDTSGDNGTGDSVILSKTAQAAAKSRGPFQLIGYPTDLVSAGGDTYTADLHLCAEGLLSTDKAVTAVSVVEVLDGTNTAEFASKCENIFTDYDEDGIDDDGIDQSNFDLSDYYITCP